MCPPAAGSAGASGEGGGTGSGGASGNAGTGGTAGLGGGGSGGGNGGSGGLACAAPAVNCDGACVNVKADDADHCGACGRSCRGSNCEAGACKPEAMTASGEVAPYALADDGTYLYWVSPAIKVGSSVSDARMRRVAKANARGAAENVFGSAVVRARALAVDGGKLFWGDLEANGVLSGTPGSLFPDSPAFAADQLDVRHLAVAAGKAFWSVGGEGAVRSKPLAGGAISPELFGQPNPGWVAAFLLGRAPAKAAGYAGNPFGAAHVLTDATHVYFADVGTVDIGQVVPTSDGDGVVYRVAK